MNQERHASPNAVGRSRCQRQIPPTCEPGRSTVKKGGGLSVGGKGHESVGCSGIGTTAKTSNSVTVEKTQLIEPEASTNAWRAQPVQSFKHIKGTGTRAYDTVSNQDGIVRGAAFDEHCM